MHSWFGRANDVVFSTQIEVYKCDFRAAVVEFAYILHRRWQVLQRHEVFISLLLAPSYKAHQRMPNTCTAGACACVCACLCVPLFQDDDVKVTIDQPDAESAGSAVAFVEGRMNCAAATAVMDMKVRLQMLWLARGTRREAWHRVCRGAGLRWRVRCFVV